MIQIIKLLESITWSYFSLSNVLFLYVLSLFSFSLLGCFIYKDASFKVFQSKFSFATEFYNFDDFYRGFSLILLSFCDTYELFMMEYARINQAKINYTISILYFMSYYFFCRLIMFNLFLLVILMQYDEFYQKNENPIEKFEKMARVFKKYWSKFIKEEGCSKRIKSYHIKGLLDIIQENRKEENLVREELLMVTSKKKIQMYILKLNLLM